MCVQSKRALAACVEKGRALEARADGDVSRLTAQLEACKKQQADASARHEAAVRQLETQLRIANDAMEVSKR
jgi:hypothetical protein